MGNEKLVKETFERTGDPRLYEVARWREEELDMPLWHRRTAHMISLLERYLSAHGEANAEADEPQRLLELGCGAMAAERMLSAGGLAHLEYLPSDCFARDHRTLVLDLNDPDFVAHVPEVTVVLIGGVLEYLDEPERVLRALAGRTRTLFFSYCPRMPDQDERSRRGWKNHLTEDEMRALAHSLGSDLCVDDTFDREAKKPVRTYFVRVPDTTDPA
ncbi:MAG: hypothetical protein JRG82_17475 [Deltaproteobacteria bacterium]|nr:hypothetical protein [Deltaproteobacteria bacterium]